MELYVLSALTTETFDLAARTRGRKVATSCPEIIMSFSSLASYRLATMQELVIHFGSRLEIYAGDHAHDAAIRLIRPGQLEFTQLKNGFLPGEILIQRVPLRRYIRCRTLLLDLNPRIPHVWILLLVRMMLRRRTILWGHAWPRSGPASTTDRVRHMMRRMADSLITYTTTQASELRVRHTNKQIVSAPNALYRESEFAFDDETMRDTILYVGRLHKDKKPDLLVRAFGSSQAECSDLRLIIVGDGDFSNEVQALVDSSPAGGSIQLLGFISDYQMLRRLYSRAIATVSPGYVGLSITQSLSFGVPMIISRDEDHSPELEAAEEGVNCVFFETDSVTDLSAKMLDMAADRESWRERGQSIKARCASKYSVEQMVAGLIAALEGTIS